MKKFLKNCEKIFGSFDERMIFDFSMFDKFN